MVWNNLWKKNFTGGPPKAPEKFKNPYFQILILRWQTKFLSNCPRSTDVLLFWIELDHEEFPILLANFNFSLYTLKDFCLAYVYGYLSQTGLNRRCHCNSIWHRAQVKLRRSELIFAANDNKGIFWADPLDLGNSK